MAITFPTTLDSLNNPGPTDNLENATTALDHDQQHSNANDAIEALEAKVGINNSAVNTSLDYLLKNTSNGHDHDGVDSKKVLVTKLDVTGLSADRILTVNSGGTAVSSISSATPAGALVGTSDSQTLTNKTLTSPIVNGGTIATATIDDTNLVKLRAQEGFLINGRLSPTVVSNDLVLTIVGLDGNTPSATNPVYCRIGNTVRSITGALSVTAADGTNWANLGCAELATQDVDLFAYLGYNATDGVVLGWSRKPDARKYSEFSATSTDEKYAKISTITNAAASDSYVNIGRFAATLSAGAGYTWSVPTYTSSNLVAYPCFQTRTLTFAPVYTGFGAGASPTAIAQYTIIGNQVIIDHNTTGVGTSNATGFTVTLPIQSTSSFTQPIIMGVDNNTPVFSTCLQVVSRVMTLCKGATYTTTSWTNSGYKYTNFRIIVTW